VRRRGKGSFGCQTGVVPAKRSAGILLFRRVPAGVEVLLGHMGGPFWARKDAGAWTIVKGEYEPPEEPEAAARREFTEELGLPAPSGEYLSLGEVRQSGGKTVTAWAVAGDLDPATIVPGTFELEWPPRSGKRQTFPELDRVAWFGLAAAAEKIVGGQRAFLERLAEHLADLDHADRGPGVG
jgi:predicted NUDIX family NTP pyrophosphohydrolase